jgi:hypothetical protein
VSEPKPGGSGVLLTGALAVILVGAVAVGVVGLVLPKESARTMSAAGTQSAAAAPVPSPSRTARPGRPVAGHPPGRAGSSGSGGSRHRAGRSAPSKGSSSNGAAAPVASYAIKGYGSGRCIDVSGGGRSGAAVQLWSCTGASWQRWSFRSGTIRSGGQCLTAAGEAGGASIVAAPCSGGSSQRFRLNGSSDIVHSGTSLCVDAKDKGAENGTLLQLWNCNGQPNQKWYTA